MPRHQAAARDTKAAFVVRICPNTNLGAQSVGAGDVDVHSADVFLGEVEDVDVRQGLFQLHGVRGQRPAVTERPAARHCSRRFLSKRRHIS